MRRILKFSLFFLLFSPFFLSCEQDSVENKVDSQPALSKIEQVKTFFETEFGEAYVLNLASGVSGAKTRSASQAFLSEPVVPNWKDAIITPYNGGRIVEIPVQMPGDIYALKRVMNQGVTTHERIRVQSRLVVYEGADGQVAYRIATIIPDKSFYQSHKDEMKTLSSLVAGTDFTGTVIHSHLNGRMNGGRYYVNGVSMYVIRSGAQAPATRAHVHTEECDHDHDHAHAPATRSTVVPEPVPAEEFNLSLSLVDRKSTPVSYMSSWEYDDPYEGDPVDASADYCWGCNRLQSQCICNQEQPGCWNCNSPYCYGECLDPVCGYCQSRYCNGECLYACSICNRPYCNGECLYIGGGQNPPPTTPPPGNRTPTVTVPSGLCVIGSIAAALQVKYGLTAQDAINRATAALQSQGVTTTPQNGGISVSGEEVAFLGLAFLHVEKQVEGASLHHSIFCG